MLEWVWTRKGFFGQQILLRIYVESFIAPFIAFYGVDHYYV